MITKNELTKGIKSFLDSQLNLMNEENPMVGFFKPFITRALNKNYNKLEKMIDLVAEEDGTIDIEGIMSEIIESLITTKPFTINTSFIGDINIGGGNIKINIPFTNKRLIFNSDDIRNFKESLIKN